MLMLHDTANDIALKNQLNLVQLAIIVFKTRDWLKYVVCGA